MKRQLKVLFLLLVFIGSNLDTFQSFGAITSYFLQKASGEKVHPKSLDHQTSGDCDSPVDELIFPQKFKITPFYFVAKPYDEIIPDNGPWPSVRLVHNNREVSTRAKQLPCYGQLFRQQLF